MKTIFNILSILFLIQLSTITSAQEYYFRFVEPEKNIINTEVTRAVSIDNLVGDTVYAYANSEELQLIKKMGYEIEMLPHPSSQIKGRGMATSVEEMANWDKYPTYETYRAMMKKFEADYPQLCKLDSIGTTINGHKLYVVKISDNVQEEESETEFFYTSTMHGDETTGWILTLRLIDSLLVGYGNDPRMTNLVNNLAIYINPNANPDGTYYGGNNTVDYAIRYNANGKDLNRNFPDPRVGDYPTGPHQPETLAFMDFAASRNFSLAANFHGGIELANYPWDAWTSSTKSHADNDWYYSISREYADLAQANSPAGYFDDMNNGVTNGGDWYVVAGGRQDYMNYWHNCREVTLEISNTKNPASSYLPLYWEYNKEAMITYIENVFTGIHGVVLNELGEPLDASITIAGHDMDNSFVVTNPSHGNYLRMIQPGTYSLTYSATGSESTVVNGVSIGVGEVKMVNVALGSDIEHRSVSGVVHDFDTFESISNATVVALTSDGEFTTLSNELGEFQFENLPVGGAKFDVSAEGYFNGFYFENTNSGQTLDLKLIKTPTYTVTFEVLDQQNQPLEGVNVIFNDITVVTNTNGLAVYSNVMEGTYSYEIAAEGYQVVESNVEVSNDELITINLNAIYTVTFEILDQDNQSLEGIEVVFNDLSIITDADGYAIYSNVVEGNYSYEISAEGYQVVESEIFISEDELVTVNLIPLGVNFYDFDSKVKTWPNPFSDFLDIEVNLERGSNLKIELYSITGSRLATITNHLFESGDHAFRWNMSSEQTALADGIYIVKITTDFGVVSKRVIFYRNH